MDCVANDGISFNGEWCQPRAHNEEERVTSKQLSQIPRVIVTGRYSLRKKKRNTVQKKEKKRKSQITPSTTAGRFG